jgi:hypothetical protein
VLVKGGGDEARGILLYLQKASSCGAVGMGMGEKNLGLRGCGGQAGRDSGWQERGPGKASPVLYGAAHSLGGGGGAKGGHPRAVQLRKPRAIIP